MKNIERVFWFIFLDTVMPVLFFASGFYSIWFCNFVKNPYLLGLVLIALGCLCRITYWWIEDGMGK